MAKITRVLLIDLDDTVLDFRAAEREAVMEALKGFGIPATDEAAKRYSSINSSHWAMLEKKELTRERLRVSRFEMLLGELNAYADAAEVAAEYEKRLSRKGVTVPGAVEMLKTLKGKYRIYAVSNGTEWIQKSRVEKAGIGGYFDGMFVSQAVGFDKPDRRFFEHCFAQIPGFVPHEALIYGDSLSSDMQGGKNAEIRTVWFNPEHNPSPAENPPDYIVGSHREFSDLLKGL